MFCGAVHICPVYSASENARLRREALEVVGRVDDDLVDAGLLRIHLRLARVLLEPAAVRGAAGEVDDLHFRAQRELLRVSSPASCATSETMFGSNPASASTSRRS
jgi:hypothetical protein